MISAQLALAVALAGGAAGQEPQQCLIIRYAADGTRSEQIGDPRPFGVSIGSGGARITRLGQDGRSSVSASSSSGPTGSRTSSTTDDGRRSVTVQTDQSGCTVIVDERPHRRRNP